MRLPEQKSWQQQILGSTWLKPLLIKNTFGSPLSENQPLPDQRQDRKQDDQTPNMSHCQKKAMTGAGSDAKVSKWLVLCVLF
jgi:hypothetical protein